MLFWMSAQTRTANRKTFTNSPSWDLPTQKKFARSKNPIVGLISNGEEAGKGSQLVKETYPLLKDSGLNFYGNVEGKEVIGGEVDVAVTDGFTGNVMLKSSEAVAKLLTDKIREMIQNWTHHSKVGRTAGQTNFTKTKETNGPKRGRCRAVTWGERTGFHRSWPFRFLCNQKCHSSGKGSTQKPGSMIPSRLQLSSNLIESMKIAQ